MVATHQPLTLSTKELWRASLSLLHGNPATQGHESDTKMGCAVTLPRVPAPDKNNLLQNTVECLFLQCWISKIHSRFVADKLTPFFASLLQLSEVCTPAWKTGESNPSKNLHHSCVIKQCLGDLQRRGREGENHSAAVICIISHFFSSQ